MFSNALIFLITLALAFSSILTSIISSIRAIPIPSIRPITMPSLPTLLSPLVTPLYSSSAVIITPLLTGSLIAIGRVLGWPSFSEFIPFVLGLVTYLFKVHPALGFVFVTFFSLFAFAALGISEDADVSTWLVIPWLIAQAGLWMYTSYGWYAWWAASIAIAIKNYGMSPPVWCIPQILTCLCLKQLWSYFNEEHIRQFGYRHSPDCVTYLYNELQKLEWGVNIYELKDLCLQWRDWFVALVRRVAEQFTARPNPPARPTPTPTPPARPVSPALPVSSALSQPTPLLYPDGSIVPREQTITYEPIEPEAFSSMQRVHRPFLPRTASGKYAYNQWLKEKSKQRREAPMNYPPILRSTDRPIASARPFSVNRPLLTARRLEGRERKRFSLADWPGHHAFLSGLENSASGFLNGAPVFGALTAPAPVPVPELQLPPQPIYQQVFHQPEWVPESQPPQIASVVVYPANNVNINTPCEPAVPALGQAIDIYNHNATHLYITPQEPAPVLPAPMEVDIPEQEEILDPMDIWEDVQEHDVLGFMSVEEMEAELANADDNNTNVGQNDKSDEKPGYESLDDRMGASPFNDCKIRKDQTPTTSQSRPLHKPKSIKPRALSSSGSSSDSSNGGLTQDSTYRYNSKGKAVSKPSVQSSSTSQSNSLGGGLQASMYNANNLASAAQTPSSQALPSALQSKPTVNQSPLAKAFAQFTVPQMPLPQAQPTIAQSPSALPLSQLSVPQMPLPETQFQAYSPAAMAAKAFPRVFSPVPVVPMSEFSVPQVQLPQVPPSTPKPKQTVQQMPLPQDLPQTPKPKPTTSQLTWPQPAPSTSEPRQTMPQVLPPLKPDQTIQQKPPTQDLPQTPKPQPTTSTSKPKQTTPQEPSTQALPQMLKAQKEMAGRRIATPKSRKAMINQAEKPSSTTAAQEPAPKKPQAPRLPGKSKPANATSTLYTVPVSSKGKGPAAKPVASQPEFVDEEEDFEDKVCEFMDGGLSHEQAYTMAEHYFNQRKLNRR
ncbi:hypothetical protein F4813DRAFT_397134 [Daldinia decipiens]|uniref:uncharacterized protein n=1 Tax=Daldinia decipiens TaxID=326647 RepID=UPI0020C52994|nr:uncharacterized protein F4813DRAFT_397134 [Daldinia decipiens]KAI1656885.1 hypothetical protein F4813DRAFT_397134 [Daldinia decipiens]